MADIQKINYQGWPNCYRLTNGSVELVVTTDVGPRIIRFGWVGGDNEFYEDPQAAGQVGSDKWQLYGGHRLWHAPEIEGRTTALDNGPVAFEQHNGFVRLVQPVDVTGIQKEIDLTLAADMAHVRLVHRLRNTGMWGVEFAPWALSVMSPGGRAILPLPPRGSHPQDLLPTSLLVLWAYVDLADPRWTWGRQYILLQQEAGKLPQKVGSASSEGWLAYAHRQNLFVKTYEYQPGAAYPDMGSAVEVFTNSEMLELETLGPVVKLEPGQTVEHVENWFLFRDVPEPKNDADVAQYVLPKIQQAKAAL